MAPICRVKNCSFFLNAIYPPLFIIQDEEAAQKALALDGNELKGKPVKLRMWASLKDRPSLGVVVLNLPFGKNPFFMCMSTLCFTFAFSLSCIIMYISDILFWSELSGISRKEVLEFMEGCGDISNLKIDSAETTNRRAVFVFWASITFPIIFFSCWLSIKISYCDNLML